MLTGHLARYPIDLTYQLNGAFTMFTTIIAVCSVIGATMVAAENRAARGIINDLESHGYHVTLTGTSWQVYHSSSRQIVVINQKQLITLRRSVIARGF